jgi:FkbM family methyltransferase
LVAQFRVQDPPVPSQLSYSQNMEDVHLARIFEGVAEGFTIDIGAGHPVADNVSLKSYLAGWRGLVVEPQEALHRLYARVRPRDIAIRDLVGRTAGEIDFHVVDRLHGFSTTVEAHAAGAGAFGAGYVTERRAMTTLAALCEAHAPSRIEWLKIDVEGAEADVLAGHDWTRHRPRLVLIEAVAPGSMAPSHEGWEPILLGAGYRFVFFDGLNRFYLAEEAADLAPRVPATYQDWGSVPHLYQFGRAAERADHPDHALAAALAGLDPASLPLLPDETVFGFLTKNMTAEALAAPAEPGALARLGRLWLGPEGEGLWPPAAAHAPTLAAAIRLILACDAFRVALGRIAAAHDGGLILTD